MTTRSRMPVESSPDYLDVVRERVARGEQVGGVLWIGCPAEAPDGVMREQTCRYSEGAVYGQAWLDLPRCLKQIVYSCDGCMRYLDKPFYEPVGR